MLPLPASADQGNSRGRGFQQRQANFLQLLEQPGGGRPADSGGRSLLATAHISRDTNIAMLRLMIGAHTNLP
jgi:hypothetical protein